MGRERAQLVWGRSQLEGYGQGDGSVCMRHVSVWRVQAGRGTCLYGAGLSSAAAKGCFWKMTPTRGITRCHLFLVIEDSMGYVESVVVVK